MALIAAAKLGDISDLLTEIEKAKSDTVVISIENLFADQSTDSLRAIAEKFSGFNTEIVAVLRQPEKWIVSRYVEEVLSGNQFGKCTLSEFIGIKSEAIVYADRLDLIQRTFKPRKLYTINYDEVVSGKGLIMSFLQATRIPVTDKKLAAGLRANVREKSQILVEGKRRLNTAMPRFPLTLRQEHEALLRTYFRQTGRDDSLGSHEMASGFRFDSSLSDEILRSNDKLVSKFGLRPAFPQAKFDDINKRAYREALPGMSDLIVYGLKSAADIIAKNSNDHNIDSYLNLQGIDVLIDLLSEVKTSLHIGCAETALWAACYVNKLVFLSPESMSLVDYKRLSDFKLPSEIVVSDERSSYSANPPDLLVVSPGREANEIATTWVAAGKTALVALMAYSPSFAIALAERLDLTCRAMAGEIYVLARPDRLQTGKQK